MCELTGQLVPLRSRLPAIRGARADGGHNATVGLVAAGAWRSPDAGQLTFADVATASLDSNPAKRPTTLARDTTVVRVHLLPMLGAMRLDQLRPSDVKATIDAMANRGLAPRTIGTNYGVLRAILAWAVQDVLIARSPCRGIRLPEVAKTCKPMASADDIARLVDRIRHSAGHLKREAGVPLEIIQRRLGHASIRTAAAIYGSLPESIDRVVAAQLDDLSVSLVVQMWCRAGMRTSQYELQRCDQGFYRGGDGT